MYNYTFFNYQLITIRCLLRWALNVQSPLTLFTLKLLGAFISVIIVRETKYMAKIKSLSYTIITQGSSDELYAELDHLPKAGLFPGF